MKSTALFTCLALGVSLVSGGLLSPVENGLGHHHAARAVAHHNSHQTIRKRDAPTKQAHCKAIQPITSSSSSTSHTTSTTPTPKPTPKPKPAPPPPAPKPAPAQSSGGDGGQQFHGGDITFYSPGTVSSFRQVARSAVFSDPFMSFVVQNACGGHDNYNSMIVAIGQHLWTSWP